MTEMEKDEKRSSERPDISFSADGMIPARKDKDETADIAFSLSPDDTEKRRADFEETEKLLGWAPSGDNGREYGVSGESFHAVIHESEEPGQEPPLAWNGEDNDAPKDMQFFGTDDRHDDLAEGARKPALEWGDGGLNGSDVYDVSDGQEEKKPFGGLFFDRRAEDVNDVNENDVSSVIPENRFERSEDTLYKGYNEPAETEQAKEFYDRPVSAEEEVSNVTDRLFGLTPSPSAEPPRDVYEEKVIAEDITPVIPQTTESFEETAGFAEIREEVTDEYQSGDDGFAAPGEQAYFPDEEPAEDITPVIPQNADAFAEEYEPQSETDGEYDPEDADFYGGYEEFADTPDNTKKPEKEGAGDEDGYDPRYDDIEYGSDEKNKGAGFTMRTADDQDRKKTATAQPDYWGHGDEACIAERIAKLRSGLTMRAVMMFFASVFSIFITVANDLEAPLTAVFDRTVNPSAYLFTNTILGIIAIGFGYSMVTMGIKNLLKFSPDSDSLAALNLLVAVVSGLITLFNPETLKVSAFHLYTSVAITGMLFNTLGKLSVARRAERNFEFVSSAETFYAVRCAEDGTLAAQIKGGRPGRTRDLAFMRKTDFVRDFIKNSYSYDLADLFAEKAGILIFLGSVAVGVLSLIFDPNDTDAMGKVFIFLAAMSGTLSLSSSFALSVVAARPLSAAGREVIEEGGVMLGYSSAEEFADVGSVLFDAEQLFPANSVQLVNIKLLGSVSLERSLSYAASLAEAGRLLTRPAFERMFEGESVRLEEVNDCAAEEGTGVSGWISSRRMLLGSREMMKRHKIDGLPSESSEDSFAAGNRVLYLAVSGRAALMFSVRLTADKYTAEKLRELQSEGVDIFVRCADGILSSTFIAEKFDLKIDNVQLVPSQLEPDIEEMCSPSESLSASMFCSGKAHSLAALLIAAKRVKASANIGVAIQYGEMVLGIATAAVMMMIGRFGQVSPTVAIVFNMVFFAVTLILQKVRK